MRRRLLWQIYPATLLVTFCSMAGTAWVSLHAMHRSCLEAENVPSCGFLDSSLGFYWGEMALAGMALAALAATLSYLVLRRLSRPLEEIRRQAQRLAQGDLSHHPAVSHASLEIGGLAEALNHMADQLHQRIQQLDRQRNEQAAVLNSMFEGVFAVDAEERLLNINPAAAKYFGVAPEAVRGRSLYEVVRHPELQELVRRTLQVQQATEGEMSIASDKPRYFQVSGTPLIDAQGRVLGALMVLNNVTRLRRLEQVRRDFVANVSHELKTPITSIKGYVETLQDGALDNPPEARKFLEIIATHTDRLHTIIEDLLSLSRLEQEAERRQLARQETSVAALLEASRQLCEGKAAAAGLHIQLSCPAELRARLNVTLLEHALVNLIDNAIKYSGTAKAIEVGAQQRADELLLTVRDWGVGIDQEHLPRIFERFYRVDKARSRKLGGTGLGLAIVKHVAEAHSGRVTVESEVGKGSCFSICLPLTAA